MERDERMGRVIKIWFSNDFSLSSKVGETRRLAILLVGHGGAHYQASSRGFFPLAAVTIFAEHLNGILYRLSLSLSVCRSYVARADTVRARS